MAVQLYTVVVPPVVVVEARNPQKPMTETAPGGGGGGSPTTYYLMRGRDQTCPGGSQPAYVMWLVSGSPDPTASELNPASLPCGATPATDVVEIVISHSYTV